MGLMETSSKSTEEEEEDVAVVVVAAEEEKRSWGVPMELRRRRMEIGGGVESSAASMAEKINL